MSGVKEELKVLGKCSLCGAVIKEGEFRDKYSEEGHRSSGMCQTCLDHTWDDGK